MIAQSTAVLPASAPTTEQAGSSTTGRRTTATALGDWAEVGGSAEPDPAQDPATDLAPVESAVAVPATEAIHVLPLGAGASSALATSPAEKTTLLADEAAAGGGEVPPPSSSEGLSAPKGGPPSASAENKIKTFSGQETRWATLGHLTADTSNCIYYMPKRDGRETAASWDDAWVEEDDRDDVFGEEAI